MAKIDEAIRALYPYEDIAGFYSHIGRPFAAAVANRGDGDLATLEAVMNGWDGFLAP